MRKSPKRLGFFVLLCSVSFLIYAPSLRGDFLWDDDAYISQNATLDNLQGLHDIWFKPGAVQQYYPVTFTVFWIARHLWGLDPLGYHALNVLLHAANALIIGLLLEALAVPGAWVAAFLFALHPVMAESVAWMTELKNVLSTFFYLLAGLCLLKYYRARHTATPFYLGGLVLFFAALLSKSVALTLPVSFLLIRWWWRGKWDRRDLAAMFPFLLLGFGVASYTAYYEHHWVRAQGASWDFNLYERLGIAGRAFWFYLGKLIYPAGLSFIYPKWTLVPSVSAQLLWPAAAISLLVLLAYGSTWWGKLPFACLLFFAITIGPALGLTSFYFMRFSYVADHFQYLAAIGVLTLFGWVISLGLKKLGTPLSSPAGVVVACFFSVNLALATARQSAKYEDTLHLWGDTLSQNPDSAIAHHNMGVALADRGQWNQAVAHFRTAEAIDTTFPQTHLALAFLAANARRWGDARHQVEESIRFGNQDRDLLGALDRAIRQGKPLSDSGMRAIHRAGAQSQ